MLWIETITWLWILTFHGLQWTGIVTYLKIVLLYRNRYVLDGNWLRHWLNVRGIVVQFPAGTEYLAFLRDLRTDCTVHPLVFFNVHRGSFPARSVTSRGLIRPLTSIIVPRLRKSGATTPLPHMPFEFCTGTLLPLPLFTAYRTYFFRVKKQTP